MTREGKGSDPRGLESRLDFAYAFGESLSTTLQRTDTQLLHETEQICIVPLLLNLAVRDAVDGDPCNRGRFASRRDAHQFAFVIPRPTACDFVALRNEVFDFPAHIGNGASVRLDNLTH